MNTAFIRNRAKRKNTDFQASSSLEAYVSPLAQSPAATDGSKIEPASWLNCWSSLDGNARMVVTPERVLLWADKKARSALTREEELRLRGMRVEPTDLGELVAFEQFLDVSGERTNTLCLPRARDRGHLLLRAAHLTDASGMSLIGLVFHGTGIDFTPEWANLGLVFNLTAAEDRVVRQLLSGLSAERIAVTHNLSIDTVRTHIRHAYDKLGISCREDLWRRLAPYRLN